MKAKYDHEVKKLRALLENTQRQMHQITGFYQLTKNIDGTEGAEILKVIKMCEDGYMSVGAMLWWLRYFEKPGVECKLSYNQATGRYMAGDLELTCGSRIELFVSDKDDDDVGRCFGRVEYNTEYYFLTKRVITTTPWLRGLPWPSEGGGKCYSQLMS